MAKQENEYGVTQAAEPNVLTVVDDPEVPQDQHQDQDKIGLVAEAGPSAEAFAELKSERDQLLDRLARLQAESPMEEWARHYITEIAPSLDIEGRKIAMQMLARKLKDEFVLRQNSNLEPLGPEEKRQMEILRIGVGDPVLGQCGVEWKELPKGYENECSTADEITRWAEDLNLMGKYSDPSLTGS